MRKILPCLALLALFSCKDDTVKPINDMEITTVEEPEAETTEAVKKEEDIEKVISGLQADIEKSSPSDRKALLDKYLEYSPKMNGAVAESYGNFTFEYEQEHTSDLYSVLTPKDTGFVKQWAKEAASEVMIQVETEADAEAFFQDLKHTNEAKAAILNEAQKELFNLYHQQLEEDTYKLIRN
jgi:hypothetical protein